MESFFPVLVKARVSVEHRDALQRLAKARHVRVSEIIREAIGQYLAAQSKPARSKQFG